MNKKLPAWIVLTVICLVAALALAFTYNGTKDRIAQQEEAKTVAVRQALLPAAASFEAVDGSEVYRGVDANGAAVGYVTVNTVKGFCGDVEISVAVDPEGVIQGISVGGANFKETAGLGAKSKEPAFTEQFAGKTAPVALKKNGGEIDAITAATITSSAVVRGVNDAVTMLAEKAGFTIQQAASAVEEKGNGRYATEKQGFAGPVYVELALDGEGKITEIAIGDDRFSETSGFGAKAREEAFYGQYIGKTGQLTLGQDIDAVSGATITSTAVNDAVNLILLYVNDPAAYAAQQSAEPVNVGIPEGAQAYTAQAKGLTGTFPVSISVDEQGMVSGIAVEDSESANDAAFVQRVQNDTAFLSQFIGQAAPFDEAAIDTVTGATVSSKAVIAAVNQAYNAAMGIAEPTAAPTAEPTEVPTQSTVAEPAEGTVVSAQAKGLTGEFPVNVTVDESNAIVKVELGDSSTDTDASFLNMVKTDTNYLNQFVGKTAPVDEASIDVVAGATVSSKAVVAAVNAACENLPEAGITVIGGADSATEIVVDENLPAAEEAPGTVLTAQGKGLTGEFPVNVTVDESNAIVKVELGDSSTDMDANFLNMVKTDANYLNQFVGKTAPVDETSIDVVAGATVSSKAVVAAVNAACENLPKAEPAAEEAAGTVLTAQGKGLTGEFPVNVTVDESNAIVKVELGESSTDTDAGFLNMVKTDANYLNQFVGKTAPVDEASIDVVAGATVSSKAVVAAVNAAFASQGE
ncbi:MAG: RnfABCDGE type electron transport complex subunit G [Clostridiales bacterium]|nr:RnfABCDGE type electron transport complex subunit G [Clostridiales bacterium]MDY5468453.1 RnfABCDGE type electron transport complex subunit G [Eubacteriales bacterium]